MNGKNSIKYADLTVNEGELLHRMTNRIRQSLELQEILSATVAEMRSFLETDRVKVYRFEPDGTGQVIAESIYQDRLPSLKGLHFPASDIPAHAREMFLKARTRSIVDVQAQQITLSHLEYPDTTGDLTVEDIHRELLEDILQRPVDPCHLEYLTAMGVKSSLVVPIVYDRKLWGLLVSHHADPKTFSPQELQIVQLVADQVSVAIAQSSLLAEARAKARREALINEISTLLHAPLNVQEILLRVLQKVSTAIGASGGRLYIASTDPSSAAELYTYGDQPQLYTCGTQPLQPDTGKPLWLEQSDLWQELLEQQPMSGSADFPGSLTDLPEREEGGDRLLASKAVSYVRAINNVYEEPLLATVTSAFRSSRIRGLLAMPLQYSNRSLGCLTLFRDEIDTDILWAGRFDPDDRQQRVRDSFQAWRELKLGQTRCWSPEEIELARAVGTHLSMAVMQNRLYQWEREHRLLVEMRNQELNAARAAAEEASRLKSDFLSSTSHELRTPLASTLNYLKLLKEGFYESEEELREYISIAHQSAENLVAIINDVLDIAKIEAGRMNVNYEAIDLPPLLEEQRRLFSLDSRRKGIPLIVECEVDSLRTDKVKLRQVLTNLLSNAFKFTSAGEVRLRACTKLDEEREASKPHEASSTRRKSRVEISVADTGIGIEPNKPDLLFEPFVQADGSIKRRYGGTGLGLTVCKRLVELMGGQIWIESGGHGCGTTVTFTLPCK